MLHDALCIGRKRRRGRLLLDAQGRDIDVQIHKGVLSIKARHNEEQEASNGQFHRRERRTGTMVRHVELPGVLDESAAEAELADGVLTLRIPVQESNQPRQITVN